MSPRFLTPPAARVIDTPAQAKDLYRRYPREAPPAAPATIALDAPRLRQAGGAFTGLRRAWLHREDAPGRDIWGQARRVWQQLLRGGRRLVWAGDCDDFAWQLLLILRAIDGGRAFPRGALRLTAGQAPQGGRLRGHLVLTIETEAGTVVLDSLQAGPLWSDDPAFARYRWQAREHGPVWVSLASVSLADAAAAAQARGAAT